jgi:hypothetical protein
MRTTIHIPDDILAEFKRQAAKSHRTLASVITDALREALARRRKQAPKGPVQLTTFDGGGLQPGVDLDDSAALLDRLETE